MVMTGYGACPFSAASDEERHFSGKERDNESGLDYFLARYYSAAQGRFTSPDEFKGGIADPFTGQQVEHPGPLPHADITDPQTLNKYAYVRNNPLRYIDPDGRFALPWELLDLYSYNESRKAWVQAAHDFQENPSVQTGLVAAAKFLENSYDLVALATPALPAFAGLLERGAMRSLRLGQEINRMENKISGLFGHALNAEHISEAAKELRGSKDPIINPATDKPYKHLLEVPDAAAGLQNEADKMKKLPAGGDLTKKIRAALE